MGKKVDNTGNKISAHKQPDEKRNSDQWLKNFTYSLMAQLGVGACVPKLERNIWIFFLCTNLFKITPVYRPFADLVAPNMNDRLALLVSAPNMHMVKVARVKRKKKV